MENKQVRLYSSHNVLLNEIHMNPNTILKNHFNFYDTVKVFTDSDIILLEVIPNIQLEENEGLVHPSILENVFMIKHMGSLVNISQPCQPKNVNEFTMSLYCEHKQNLDFINNYLNSMREKSLFGKDGVNDWLSDSILRKMQNYLICRGCNVVLKFLGELFVFQICDIQSNEEADIFCVNEQTKIKILDSLPSEKNQRPEEPINLQFAQTETFIRTLKVGGLEPFARKIMETMDIALTSSSKNIPRCLLLWGLEGTGKTSLIMEICEEYQKRNVKYFYLSGEKINIFNFQEIVDSAFSHDASLIVIDDFDVIGRKVKDSTSSWFGVLHQCIDKVNASPKPIGLIAISRNINLIDSSFRVSGKFEREIYLPVPNMQARKSILKILTSKLPIKERNEILFEKLCTFTPGFVGRDIERLCRQAFFHALSRNKDDIKIEWEDFEYALRIVKPSQLSDFGVSVPSVSWDEVGGYEEVKKRCKEVMFWPFEYPESYKRLGLPSNSGLLLYGPSGCGKTLIIQALASHGKMNFISIKSPEIFSKYTGQTEQAIRRIFKKARQLEPCVLVFDEIDAIAPRRDLDDSESDSGSSRRALSQLLNEMDGIQNKRNVFIVGCTNRKELIDQAILRPGRLDQMIQVGYPTEKDRLEILKVITKRMPIDDDVDFEELARTTKGFTGADLKSICREAAILTLRENMKSKYIQRRHFYEAVLNHKL